MCTYKNLHHSTHGYVIQCWECQHIQVGFGTTIISYSPAEFVELRRKLYQCDHLYRDSPFPEMKCVHIPQTAPNVWVVYTPQEISQLTGLLEMAALALEVERVLNIN
jgi:hypothetical protein